MLLRTSRHVLGPDLSGLLLSGISTYQATVLGIAPASLLAYWPLTETSGTQASDISGNARHGTYSGVTLAQIAGPGPSMGSAPLIDGVNDNLTITVAQAAINAALGNHSVSMWLKVLNSGVWADGSLRYGLSFRRASAYLQLFRKGTAANTLQYGTDGTNKNITLSTTDWFHILLLRNPVGTIGCYLNGTFQDSITTANTTAFDDGCYIGANITSSVWSGYIAHVAIFGAALSAAQITLLATAR